MVRLEWVWADQLRAKQAEVSEGVGEWGAKWTMKNSWRKRWFVFGHVRTGLWICAQTQ